VFAERIGGHFHGGVGGFNRRPSRSYLRFGGIEGCFGFGEFLVEFRALGRDGDELLFGFGSSTSPFDRGLSQLCELRLELFAGIEQSLEASVCSVCSGYEEIGRFVLREHRFDRCDGILESCRLLLELFGFGSFHSEPLFGGFELFLELLDPLVGNGHGPFFEA
jgi:hypothetical protein